MEECLKEVKLDCSNQTMKILMQLFYEKTDTKKQLKWKDITENTFEKIPTEKDIIALEDVVRNISIYLASFDNIPKTEIINDLKSTKELEDFLLEDIGLKGLNYLLDKLLAYSVIMLLHSGKSLHNNKENEKLLAIYFSYTFDALNKIKLLKQDDFSKSNQVGLLNSIDVSQLEIGMEIKNYKELCNLLRMEVKSGNSKKIQLNDFKRYFDFEKYGHKFIITDIYEIPLSKEDKRKLGNNSVYVKYIELILLQYLSKQKEQTQTFTKRNLWELLGMVNKKYNKISTQKLKEIDYIITQFEINHFYQRCNKKLEQILFSALNNLKNRKLLIWEMQTIIVTFDENGKEKYFLADDEDKKKILQVERYVLKNVMGYEKIIQVFCRFKQNEYYRLVNDKIYELYGWHHYFKQIKLIYTQKDVLEAIQQSEIDFQKTLLNEKIINVLNDNAQEKYNTEKQKLEEMRNNLIWGDYKSISESKTWVIPDTYLEAQHILTDELINIGHEKNRISLEYFQGDDELNQLFTSFMC